MFWDDDGDETSFTEMQILAYYSGALYATDPEVLWGALERAIPTVPLNLDVPSEGPEELVVFSERFRRLQESPELARAYLDLLREVWAPVDEMWQQSLPAIEEAGRHFVAQFERGTTLDVLVTPGCDIFRARLPRISSDIEGGKPVVFVPCLFFGSSLYLDFPDLVLIGVGVGPGDGEARARTESVAQAPEGRGRPHPPCHPPLPRRRPEQRGRAGRSLPPRPTDREHARQGAAPGRPGALRACGGPPSSQRRSRRRRSVARRPSSGRAPGRVTWTRRGGSRRRLTRLPQGASTTGKVRMPATVVERTRSAGPVTA